MEHRYYAIRQMDDMLLVMLLLRGDAGEIERVQMMREDVTFWLYTGGPTLLREEKIWWKGEWVRVWAGLELRVEDEGVICQTHNKNGETLVDGWQKVARYVAGESEQSDKVRRGVMIGSYARLWGQCMKKEDFVAAVEEDLWVGMFGDRDGVEGSSGSDKADD
jgi:hypothetical protein